MSVLGLICARGGSKGVARKNLALLGGKPLIAWSIEAGLRSSRIDRVLVSTEDEEIARVAREHGAEVPFLRPLELATDTASVLPVWAHALEQAGGDPELLVTLPCTSPLRGAEDVDAAVEAVLGSPFDGCLTVSPAARNPHFNMVKLEGGQAKLAIDGPPVTRRQDAPVLYDITTVAYAIRPEAVRRVAAAGTMWAARWTAVVVPPERAVDIDTPLDLAFAEFLLTR